MKTCTRCKIEKEDDLFKVVLDKRTGKSYRVAKCKKCECEYNGALQKKLRSENKEWRENKNQQSRDRLIKLKENDPTKYENNRARARNYYNTIYYPNNRDKVIAHTKHYHATSEKSKVAKKKYAEENKERLNEVKREYRKNMADRYIVSLIFNSDRKSSCYNREEYINFNNKYLIQLYKANVLLKRQIYGTK